MASGPTKDNSNNHAPQRKPLAAFSVLFLFALLLVPLASAVTVTFDIRNPLGYTKSFFASNYVQQTATCSNQGGRDPSGVQAFMPGATNGCTLDSSTTSATYTNYQRTCTPLGNYEMRVQLSGLPGETSTVQSAEVGGQVGSWKYIYTSECDVQGQTQDTGQNTCYNGNVYRLIRSCDVKYCGYGGPYAGYQVQACNAGCNATAAACIDGQAPSVVLQSPANSSTIFPNTLLNISVTAPSGVSLINYTFDNGASQTLVSPFATNATAPGPYNASSYTISVAGLAQGAHTVTVLANNTVGNLTTVTYNFRMADTTPPILLFTYFTPDDNTVVGDSSIYFDVISNELLTRGVVTLNGQNHTMNVVGSRHLDLWLDNLTNGNYTFTGYAQDASNNTGATETRTVTVAAALPALSFTAPTPGNSTRVNTNFVLVNVTSDKPLDTAILSFNGTNTTANVSAAGFTTASFNYSNNSMGLVQGTYTYRVYANDTAGNWNASELRTVVVDGTLPTLTVVAPSPANNSILLQDGFTINFTADEALSSADVTINGTVSMVATMLLNGSSNGTAIFTGMNAGAYTYQVSANDTAGNVNTTPVFAFTLVAKSSLVNSTVDGVFYANNNTGTLRAINQSNLTLSNSTNSNVTLSNVTNSSLTDTAIVGVVMDGSIVVGGTVSNSTLTNSDANQSNIANSSLVNSGVSNSSVNGSTLVLTVADNSNLSNVTLTNVLVVNSTLSNLTLSNADVVNNVLTYKNATLSGLVSYVNSTAVANANVSIEGTSLSVLANATGAYMFPSVANGTYNVTASDGLGFSATTLPTLLLPAGNTQLNITLQYTVPQVTFVTVSPNTTNASSLVKVSANATNDLPIASINATVNGTLYTLAFNATSDLWENDSVVAPRGVGAYQVNVSAANSLGTLGANNTASLNVVDSIAPVIQFIAIAPSFVNASQSGLLVVAGATDNGYIASVTATINNTAYRLSLNNSVWGNDSVTAPAFTGAFPINLTVVDAAGNSVSNVTQSLIVVDSIYPVIHSVTLTPNPAGITIPVSMTANVTDNDGLKSVNATINGTRYTLAYNATTGLWFNDTIAAYNQSGNYPVNVSAMDGSNNTAYDNSTILVVNANPPVISLTAITPNPVNVSQAGLTILANVTDDGAVTSVNATINGTLYVLSPIGGSLYQNASVVAPLSVGAFPVNVTAADNVGNIASDASSSLITVDQVAPVVTFVNTSVNPAPVGTMVAITANATDNGRLQGAVATLNGSSYVLAFNATNGLWENTTVAVPAALGNYTINATFTDTAGNSASNSTFILTVGDNQAPVVYLVAVSPNPTNATGVTVTVNASDNSAVAAVSVSINGSAPVALAKVGGDRWAVNGVSPGTGGVVNVTATDGSGNSASNATVNLVVDATAPMINSVAIAPTTVNSSQAGISVQVNATDAVTNVSAVTAKVNGTTTPLAFNATSGLWEASMTAPNATGVFVVNVTATDAVGNSSYDVGQNLTVVDGVAPVIHSVAAVPNPVSLGGNTMVFVNASDNAAVANANVTLNGSTTVLAFNGTIGLWVANITAPNAAGVFALDVWVSDAAGNTAFNGAVNLTVTDVGAPQVHSVRVSPNPALQGALVAVYANATDNVNVSSVNATIGALAPVALAFNATSGLWEGNAPLPAALGTYVVNVSALDNTGNLGYNDTYSVVDGRAPTSSAYSSNGTVGGTTIGTFANWTDDAGLSGYILSDNATGVFTNGSFTAFSGLANRSIGLVTLPAGFGTTVAWLFYANDSNGNWNQTPVQYVTTTLAAGLSNLTNTWFDHSYYLTALVGATVNLSNSNLTNVIANDSTTQVHDSSVLDTVLVNSNVTNGSTIFGSTITNATVNNCTLITVNLTNMACDGSYLDPSNVTNSVVSGGSIVIESNVSNSRIVNASDVRCSLVDLSSVNDTGVYCSSLYNVTIFGSAVFNSTLRNIVLTSVTLYNVTLDGTTASGSTLNGTTSTNSVVTNQTVAINSTFTGSSVNSSGLTNVTATNSTLYNVNASNTVIVGSSASNVNFTNANVTNNWLYNGTVTFFNTTSNSTSTYNASLNGPLFLGNIINYAPVLVSAASSSYATDTATPVTLSAIATDLNIPGPLNDSLVYTWTFGNGAGQVNGAVVPFTYPAPGVYNATVYVTDSRGAVSNSITLASITVIAAPVFVPTPTPTPTPTATPAPAPFNGGFNPVYQGGSGAPLPVSSGVSSGSGNTPTPTPTPVPKEQRASQSSLRSVNLAGEGYSLNFTRTLIITPNKASPTGWTTTMKLVITNLGNKRLEDFLVRETLPTAFATDPMEVTFNLKPLYFEKGSVIAIWKIGYLNPRDSLVLEYSVNRFLLPSYLGMFKDPQLETTRTAPAPTTSPVVLKPTPSASPTAALLTGLFSAASSPVLLGFVALVLLGVLMVVFTRPRKPPMGPTTVSTEVAQSAITTEPAVVDKAAARKEKARIARVEKLQEQAAELEAQLQKARDKIDKVQGQ